MNGNLNQKFTTPQDYWKLKSIDKSIEQMQTRSAAALHFFPSIRHMKRLSEHNTTNHIKKPNFARESFDRDFRGRIQAESFK